MELFLTETCVKNYGISFSFINTLPSYFLVILGLISLLLVVGVILFLLIKANKKIKLLTVNTERGKFFNRAYLMSLKISLFLIVFGGLVNIVSRALSGYVCDYIALIAGGHTTYLNVPDIMIVSGIILFTVSELFFNKLED